MFPISTDISFISPEYVVVCQTKPLKETVTIDNKLYQQLNLLKTIQSKVEEILM